MLQSFSKLWVDLLSNRYPVGPKILFKITHTTDSPTWSSIIHAKNAIKEGFSWRTGSGNSSFLLCPRSSLVFIGLLSPFIIIHDLHLTIKDVLCSNEQHTQVLYSHLLPMTFDLINNMHIKFNVALDDSFISTSNKNGT